MSSNFPAQILNFRKSAVLKKIFFSKLLEMMRVHWAIDFFRAFRGAMRIDVVLILLLLVVVCHCPTVAKGDSTWSEAYVHYGTENGLRGKEIYHILKDSKGYMWFGTDMGLARYDGYQFTNYSIGDGLTDNDILGLREDSKGRLWLMTLTGIPCFYYEGAFHNPQTDRFLTPIKANGMMTAFHEDEVGNLYLGFYDGSAYKIDPNLNVTSLQCDGLCRILGFGTNERLGVFSAQNINDIQSVSRSDIPKMEISALAVLGAENYPVKFLALRNQKCIYTWGRSARILDENLGTAMKEGVIPVGKILGVFEGSGGSIYLGTSSGAYHYASEELTQLLAQPQPVGKSVFSVFEDAGVGMWYGTDDGVFFSPKAGGLRYSESPLEASPSCMVAMPNHHLLVGFENGEILEFDQKLSLIKKQTTGDYSIKSFHVRDSSETWVLTSRGIFRRRVDELSRVQNFNPRDLDFSRSKDERLVICFAAGRFQVDREAFDKKFFGDSRIEFPSTEKASQCYCVKYDGNNGIWTSSSAGIEYIDATSSKRILSVEQLAGYSTIRQILPMGNDSVVFSTAGNGLIAYAHGQAYRLSVSNGLSSDYVTFVAPDSGGIWVSGTNTLDFVQSTAGGYRVSRIENLALWVKNENIVSLVVDSTHLFMATDRNIYMFDKRDLLGQSTLSSVPLGEIFVNGSPIRKTQNIQLGYDNNSIRFDYLAFSFIAADNIQYRYRLLGLSNSWNETKSRSANYSGLGAGKYVFQFQAGFAGGKWSNEIGVVQFEVMPSYWQTWWFKGIMVLVGFLLVGIVFALIYRILKRRTELINRALVAEQKALITQMNPHFIFNSLNSIQYFYLTNDIENANEYLTDFGMLIRAILENGRKPRITLQQEIDLLSIYAKLERLRLRFKFECEIVCDGIVPKDFLIPPMILQPIVENSIWHGLAGKEEGGKLRIHFSAVGDCLIARIEDNGLGRKRAKEKGLVKKRGHQSLATAITQERLELMKKDFPGQVSFTITDLVDAENMGTGTVVIIKLPLEYAMDEKAS